VASFWPHYLYLMRFNTGSQHRRRVNIPVFREVTPCRWMSGFRSVEGSPCFHLQCLAVQEDRPLKMMGSQFFETSRTTHPKTRRHIPEDLNPQQHRCDKLTSRLLSCFVSVMTDNGRSNLACRNCGRYLLVLHQSDVLFEKLIVAQLVIIFPPFCRTCLFTRVSPEPDKSVPSPVTVILIFYHCLLYTSKESFPLSFLTNVVCIFSFGLH
jgi:hypothetical protein